MNTPRFRFPVWALVLGAVAVSGTLARAEFKPADLFDIPVARLIENLEKSAKQKPKDTGLRFNLARLHAMAYAQKVTSVKVWKGREAQGVWFGYTPKNVPFAVQKAASPEQVQEAEKHLAKALTRYEEVSKLDENHLGARLGHAWLVEQSGKKAEAVKEYRAVIEDGWKQEAKLKSGRMGGHYITTEAAGYLIPLLDRDTDKAEIETLQQRSQQLQKLPRPITPVVVPLRDGMRVADILDPSARVRFDADGSGLQKSWTWIRGDAAWLVSDPHRTSKIRSGLQLFGSVTFWCFWENGYEALATLDDDRDGFLRGAELDGLGLWHDANGNGVSDPNEVRPLAEWGITGLSCRGVAGGSPDCAATAPAGVYFRDGTVRPTFDIILQQRQ